MDAAKLAADLLVWLLGGASDHPLFAAGLALFSATLLRALREVLRSEASTPDPSMVSALSPTSALSPMSALSTVPEVSTVSAASGEHARHRARAAAWAVRVAWAVSVAFSVLLAALLILATLLLAFFTLLAGLLRALGVSGFADPSYLVLLPALGVVVISDAILFLPLPGPLRARLRQLRSG